jgi:hypothetical protein
MTNEELIAIQKRYMAAVDSLLPWSKTAVDVPVLVAEVERLWDQLAAAADVIDSREGKPVEYVNESNEPVRHDDGPCHCGYTHRDGRLIDLRVGDDELDRSERAGTHGR